MIDHYAFGTITIGGNIYTADVIIYPDRVDDTWWRKEGHRLQIIDLPVVWESRPSALVVGKGSPGLMAVDPEVTKHCCELGIELIVQSTVEAVAEYNRLQTAGRTVIAALHLTC